MQVVISTLSQISASNFAGAELLQKTDHLILFHEKNEQMTIETHTMLSTMKASVEFRELTDRNNFPVFTAYLCGTMEQKASKIIVLSTLPVLAALENKKIILAENLKDALKGGERAPRGAGKASERKTTQKTAKAPETAAFAAMNPPESKQNEVTEAIKEEKPRSRARKGDKILAESTPDAPVKEKKGRQKADDGNHTIDGFKDLMKSFSTPEFDAEKSAMSVLSKTKEAIRYNTTNRLPDMISEYLESIYGLGEASKKALEGKYSQIINYVKKLSE